jgi:hypothetical protein
MKDLLSHFWDVVAANKFVVTDVYVAVDECFKLLI